MATERQAFSIKIFISFSYEEKVAKWTAGLKKRIAEKTNYHEDEIYVFLDPRVAKLNEPINAEIARNIESCEHFICVVSNEYLKSAYCMQEYFLYTRRQIQNKSEAKFFFSPYIDFTVYENKDNDFQREVERGRDVIVNATTICWSPDLREFASKDWEKTLIAARIDKRHINLTGQDWSTAEAWFGEMVRPDNRSLIDYAELSAYCLGADRYKGGGWGFSLGEVSHRDQEDGETLPSGLYSLNTVIIRAISHFLTWNEIAIERKQIFEERPVERNPYKTIADRLPQVAHLLACLENLDGAKVGFEKKAKKVDKICSDADRLNRWAIKQEGESPPSVEFNAAMLACLNKINEISSTVVDDLELSEAIDQYLKGHAKNVRELRDLIDKSLKHNSLFDLLQGDRNSTDASGMSGIARISALWLMIAGSNYGQRLIQQTPAGWQTLNVLKKEKFELAIKNGIEDVCSADGNADTITLALAASASMIGCNGEVPRLFADTLYEYLFTKIDGEEIIPKMNAIAWASILLLASDQVRSLLDKKRLSALWRSGRKLREERLQSVQQLSTSHQGLNKADLRERTRRDLGAHADDFLQGRNVFFRDSTLQSDEGRKKRIVHNLERAAFWGVEPQLQPEGNGPQMLGGILRVRTESNKIDMDSPGYNHIFLYPFSRITGMNVINLDGIRREFGDNDKTLVQIMGQTVVRRTFVYKVDGHYVAVEGKDAFAKRTKAITDEIGGKTWKTFELGMNDLLEVAKGEEKATRWVFRSAIAQPPRRPNAESLISWRFIEVPAPLVQPLLQG